LYELIDFQEPGSSNTPLVCVLADEHPTPFAVVITALRSLISSWTGYCLFNKLKQFNIKLKPRSICNYAITMPNWYVFCITFSLSAILLKCVELLPHGLFYIQSSQNLCYFLNLKYYMKATDIQAYKGVFCNANIYVWQSWHSIITHNPDQKNFIFWRSSFYGLATNKL
jgi:hypothetical protein